MQHFTELIPIFGKRWHIFPGIQRIHDFVREKQQFGEPTVQKIGT
jgi:hypothetical protein